MKNHNFNNIFIQNAAMLAKALFNGSFLHFSCKTLTRYSIRNCALFCALFFASASLFAAGPLSLNDAIKQTADELAQAQSGKRLAMTQFESEAPELSAYITDELAGSLVRGLKVKIVDRRNIEFIRKELKLRESGMVNEKTPLTLGKLSGAESVVTGSLVKTGKIYRLSVNVIGIESAENETSVVLDIAADKNYTTLLTALKSGKKTADTTYREEELKLQPETAADFVNRGITLLERGDIETAFLDFNTAVKRYPTYSLAFYWRGNVYSQKGAYYMNYETINHNKAITYYDLAISGFTQAIKLDQNFVYAYYNRGDAYYNKGNVYVTSYGVSNFKTDRNKSTACYDLAIADFTQAIELDQDNANVYSYRGDVYSGKGGYDLAIEDYTKAIELNPNNAGVYSHRGDAYSKKDGYDLAIADYTKAITLDPNNAVVYNHRGDAYSKKDGYDLAIADYTKAIELDPNNAVVYNHRGDAYSGKGGYDLAIADYTQAIKLDPNYAVAYSSRGEAYKAKGNIQKANEDFVAAENIEYGKYTEGDYIDAAYYKLRGDSYYKKNDYDFAIANYTQAITLDPNVADFYYNRGNAYSFKHESDPAIEDYTQAITIDPNDGKNYGKRAGKYYRRRGLEYSLKEDYESAIADYAEAIKLDPNDDITYSIRGDVYSKKGDYDNAIADYTQAMKLRPSDSYWVGDDYQHRGDAYSQKGDYDRAIADYTQAIKLSPNDDEVYRSRGEAQKAKGDTQKADEDFAMAEKLLAEKETDLD